MIIDYECRSEGSRQLPEPNCLSVNLPACLLLVPVLNEPYPGPEDGLRHFLWREIAVRSVRDEAYAAEIQGRAYSFSLAEGCTGEFIFSINPVVKSPFMKAGSFSTFLWKGMVVLIPSTMNSSRERLSLAIASALSLP